MAEKNIAALVESHAWTAGSAGLEPGQLQQWAEERLARIQARLDKLDASGSAEQTWRAYDDAVAELSQVASECGLLDSVYPDKAVRDMAQTLAQKVSEVATALSLNQQIYRALAAADLQDTDEATRHYSERTLLQYRLAGVDRDDATRSRLKELQEKATLLALTISRNVQEGANQVLVDDAAELDGLPADYLASHQPAADGEHAGKIILTTDFPDYIPVMTFAKSHDLRLRMFRAYNTRAYPANKQLMLDLFAVRHEVANLLGFATWADLATADQMIGSADNMLRFLDNLEEKTRKGAEAEYASILEFARTQQPDLEAIDAASRGYWLEQFRRSAYDFDSQSVRPYFPYARVQAGVLATAEKLFHVRFEPAKNARVWHSAVTAWDVFDAGAKDDADNGNSGKAGKKGALIGRFYLDMHPREGKDKWFSAAPLVPGIRGRQLPEAALICNFPQGAVAGIAGGISGNEGDPGLLQHSDVVTYLHEFGHLMHAILGGQQPWAGISGIATEGDFVEVPSQMLEEFFRDPNLLATFALHYKTDEPIPAELVQTMNRAGAFGRADWVRTQLFYTRYSLDVHHCDPTTLDLDKLLKDEYQRFLPYTWIDGNRLYSSFTHLVGYSSNYYTYLFDKVIAIDFFNQFERDSLLEGPAAMRYRAAVLDRGGSQPGTQLVKNFLGRELSPEAFEEWISAGQLTGDVAAPTVV
jgi:thimet oligopeptidase